MTAEPTPETLARMMREWRSSRGLNTAAAGALLGLSARTVEGIEQGRGHSAPRLVAIALLHLLAQKKLRDPIDNIR